MEDPSQDAPSSRGPFRDHTALPPLCLSFCTMSVSFGSEI